MAQHVAAAVLADKVAQVRSQTHVRDRRFVITPLRHGQALEQDETFPVDQILLQGLQEASEVGETEILLCFGDMSVMGVCASADR
jgi:hypothetical protein